MQGPARACHSQRFAVPALLTWRVDVIPAPRALHGVLPHASDHAAVRVYITHVPCAVLARHARYQAAQMTSHPDYTFAAAAACAAFIVHNKDGATAINKTPSSAQQYSVVRARDITVTKAWTKRNI